MVTVSFLFLLPNCFPIPPPPPFSFYAFYYYIFFFSSFLVSNLLSGKLKFEFRRVYQTETETVQKKLKKFEIEERTRESAAHSTGLLGASSGKRR